MPKIETKYLNDAPSKTVLGNNEGSSTIIKYLTISELKTLLGIGDILYKIKETSYSKSAGSITVLTGNTLVGNTSITIAATYNSTIGSVTDITDPANTGGWTDMLSITDGPFIFDFYGETSNSIAYIAFSNNSNYHNKSTRIQILIDDIVVGDGYITGNSINSPGLYFHLHSTNNAQYSTTPILCETSFKIRAARSGGNLSVNTTFLKIASIYYKKVTLVN